MEERLAIVVVAALLALASWFGAEWWSQPARSCVGTVAVPPMAC